MNLTFLPNSKYLFAIPFIASIPEWSLTLDSIKSISTLSGSLRGSNFSLKFWIDPKNSGPQISYTLVFSSFIRLRARIIVAFFHANTSAEIITPAITATARSTYTVMADTAIKTKASANGILFMIRKLDQANVPTTTINITPTSAAIGICSIKGAANKTNTSSATAAITPDSLPRPPLSTLMIDWPIIAQPPIPPNSPLRMLALP